MLDEMRISGLAVGRSWPGRKFADPTAGIGVIGALDPMAGGIEADLQLGPPRRASRDFPSVSRPRAGPVKSHATVSLG
jgi:hypothetical protein